MSKLTVARVRSVLSTNASSYAVADYMRLLDMVGFREITAMDEEAMIALHVFQPNTLAKRLNQLYTFGLASRTISMEPKRGRPAFTYRLKDGDYGQDS